MKTKYNKKRWHSLLKIVLPLMLIFSAYGCEIQKDFEYDPSGDNGALDVNAWEFIQSSDSLSLMELAITHAGLESYYASTTVRTFIVPRNSGFRTYMKTNGYASINDIPVATLQDILKYHMVNAKVVFSDPDLLLSNNPIAYDTESGSIMYLSHNSNYQGLINEKTKKSWTILTSNIEPTNGAIHITGDIVYLSI